MLEFGAKIDKGKAIKDVNGAKRVWFRVQRAQGVADPDFDSLVNKSLKFRIEIPDVEQAIKWSGYLSADVHNILAFPTYFAIAIEVPQVEEFAYRQLLEIQKTPDTLLAFTVVAEGELPPRRKEPKAKTKESTPYGHFWHYIINPRNGFLNIPGLRNLTGIEAQDFQGASEAWTRLLQVESKSEEVSPEMFGRWLKAWDRDVWEAACPFIRRAYEYWQKKRSEEELVGEEES